MKELSNHIFNYEKEQKNEYIKEIEKQHKKQFKAWKESLKKYMSLLKSGEISELNYEENYHPDFDIDDEKTYRIIGTFSMLEKNTKEPIIQTLTQKTEETIVNDENRICSPLTSGNFLLLPEGTPENEIGLIVHEKYPESSSYEIVPINSGLWISNIK